MGIFPKDRGEHKTYLKPPPRVYSLHFHDGKNKPSMMANPWRLKSVQDAVKGKIFDKSVANRRVPWPRAATATFLVPCDRIDSKLPRVVGHFEMA